MSWIGIGAIADVNRKCAYRGSVASPFALLHDTSALFPGCPNWLVGVRWQELCLQMYIDLFKMPSLTFKLQLQPTIRHYKTAGTL